MENYYPPIINQTKKVVKTNDPEQVLFQSRHSLRVNPRSYTANLLLPYSHIVADSLQSYTRKKLSTLDQSFGSLNTIQLQGIMSFQILLFCLHGFSPKNFKSSLTVHTNYIPKEDCTSLSIPIPM